MANAISAGSGENTRLAISIWLGCKRPGAGAAQQEGVAKLRLACVGIGKIAERAVKRLDAGRRAGIDHLGQRVVPEILLKGRARCAVCRSRRQAPCIRDVRRRRASFSSRARRQDRPGRDSCRACAARQLQSPSTLLTPSAVSRMAWIRIGLLDGVPRLQLRKELIEIVDVPGPSTLGSMITSSLCPTAPTISMTSSSIHGRVERVDARPKAGLAEIDAPSPSR